MFVYLDQYDIPLYVDYWAKDFTITYKSKFGPLKYGLHLMYMIPKIYTEEDRSLSDQFLHYVKNYVTNGDPNGEGLPKWEPVTDGTEVLELNVPIQKTQTPYLELFEILDDYYHYQGS